MGNRKSKFRFGSSSACQVALTHSNGGQSPIQSDVSIPSTARGYTLMPLAGQTVLQSHPHIDYINQSVIDQHCHLFSSSDTTSLTPNSISTSSKKLSAFEANLLNQFGKVVCVGYLEVTSTHLRYFVTKPATATRHSQGWSETGNLRCVCLWPLTTLRQYGVRKDICVLEFGRRSPTGEGHYFFRSSRATEIFQAIKTSLEMVQPLTTNSSPKPTPAPPQQLQLEESRVVPVASRNTVPLGNLLYANIVADTNYGSSSATQSAQQEEYVHLTSLSPQELSSMSSGDADNHRQLQSARPSVYVNMS